MGMEGRPSRTSKQRAMERVSLQQRHELEEFDLDPDLPMHPTPTRHSRKKAIQESSSDDQGAASSQESEDDQPLGSGTFDQHSPAQPTSRQNRSADHPVAKRDLELDHTVDQHPRDPHEHTHDPDPNYNDLESDFSDENDRRDEDYTDKKSQPVSRSLPLRLRITDGVVTKSGRVSKPPKPISPEFRLPYRRSKETRPATPPSRGERYRRRSQRNYRDDLIPSDVVSPLGVRSPSQARRKRPKSLAAYNGDGDDDFEDDDDLYSKGNDEDNFEPRGNGSVRKRRSRVVKIEDLNNRRSARTRAKSKPNNGSSELAQNPYALRLRSRTCPPNGIGKSGNVQRNGLSYGRNYDEEAMDGEERDRDFRTPDESEDAEELENDEEEDVLAQGTRDDVSDDDFMNGRRSRLSSRRNRKARPQRSIPAKRKRPRPRADREQNSLARETQRSYRTRRTSLHREDFYHESDPSNESSDTSEDSNPQPVHSRPKRMAAIQPNDSTATHLNEVDFLKNPMAVLDPGKQPRAKHASRYSRRRSKMRPSGRDPTASDGDDGPGSSMPPIEPIQVDLSLSWDDIGGLDHHIRALKEMVFLPLLYPEIFEKFHMEAPKGVLFYGPPGTGKTLCARALAASCGSEPSPAEPDKGLHPPAASQLNPNMSEGHAKQLDDQERDQQRDTDSKISPEANVDHGGGNLPQNEYPVTGLTGEAAAVASNGVKAHSLENSGIPQEAKASLQTATISKPDERPPTEIRHDNMEVQEDERKVAFKEVDQPKAALKGIDQPKIAFKGIDQPKSPEKKKPRVSFFMRNGADCLSKWVGEAERQLRMTFEAAKKCEPAIIFFDEIDGLAPVRSSRQDQIHSSIVSTLLGLMDGLDSRGKIIVIGATNRVDAIDPALRRPGRFDRELIFTLPNLEARRKICTIHTSKWNPPPTPQVLDAVAKMTVGYCGADLKSLCSEAAIRALRRRYPQIYESNEKLLINVDEVRVSRKDFLSAMKDIVPASHRSARTHARPIQERLLAVLNHPLQSCILILQRIFPQGLGPDAIGRCGLSTSASEGVKASPTALDDNDLLSSSDEESTLGVVTMQDQIANVGKIRAAGKNHLPARQHVLRPRLLLCGQQGLGQAQLGPALLHFFEGCPVHAIDYPSLHAEGGARSAEEALVSAFREASRSVPSVLYLPHLQLWWESASQSLRTTLVVALKDLPSDLSVLVLATAEAPISALPVEVTEIFGDMHELSAPSEEHRSQLFAPIVKASEARPKSSHAEFQARKRRRINEVLPKAPPPKPKPPSLEARAQKIHEEDRYIRALRMEMRAFVENLLRDKRFKAFWNPVDPTSAPDYYEIIKKPMDITQIAGRVDSGSYPTILAMVNDFDIMMKNAIQYNPPNTEVGAAILRRAHGLIDIVHAWVDNLNPAIVETCNKIIADRIARAEREAVTRELALKSANEEKAIGPVSEANGIQSGDEGMIVEHATKEHPADSVAKSIVNSIASGNDKETDLDEQMIVDTKKFESLSHRGFRMPQKRPASEEFGKNEEFIPAEPEQTAKLQKLLLDVSTGMTVDGLEGLYVRCEKVLHERRRSMDRASAVKALISTVLLARDDPALVGNLVE